MTFAVMAAPSLPIALVNILDGALALVAAGKVQIDVGPFATLLRKKALEQKFHADRIDSGDPQRIAHRAVGGGASALHENIIFAAEANDVPDNQEISGKIQLFDHRQFAIDLLHRPFIPRAVPVHHAFPCSCAQKLDLRFAYRAWDRPEIGSPNL